MEPERRKPVGRRSAARERQAGRRARPDRRHLVEGRQAVLELLRSERPVRRLLVARGRKGATMDELVRLAGQRGVPVEEADAGDLDRISRTARHQGVIAVASSTLQVALEPFLAAQAGRSEALVLACDQVQDPHNLGALVRSAEAAGAAGVVVPERRSAGLTPTVERAAAGATSYVPWVEVVNLARALERFQQAGFWVVGLDAGAGGSLWEVELPHRLVAVVGAEGSGLRPGVRAHCDELVRIPMRGRVGSLNVSVAGALFLFEVVRRRLAGRQDEGPSRGGGDGA